MFSHRGRGGLGDMRGAIVRADTVNPPQVVTTGFWICTLHKNPCLVIVFGRAALLARDSPAREHASRCV